MAVWCSGLARNSLTVETRVRFPTPLQIKNPVTFYYRIFYFASDKVRAPNKDIQFPHRNNSFYILCSDCNPNS